MRWSLVRGVRHLAVRAARTLRLTLGALGVAGVAAGCGGSGGTDPQPTPTPPTPVLRTLTVAVAGTGTVTSTPAGISCSTGGVGTCSAPFQSTVSVSLAATPAAGQTFAGWSDGCSGTGACTVSMDQARTVTATFAASPVASVAITPPISTLDVGQTVALAAVTRAPDSSVVTGRAVTWTTSNAAAATVSAAGVVTAVAPTFTAADTVRITATSEGKSATVAVFVRAPVVTVTASDASASEVGPDNGTFTITRTGPTTTALAVNVTLGGTATNGTDYTAIASPVSIAAGQASVMVTVAPTADALVEGNETAILTVAAGAYAIGSPASATVNIADGPPPPMNNDQTYAGRIATAGKTDTWTFTAAAGDYAVVSMGRTAVTATLTPRVRVISPTGALLGSYYATSETAAQVSVTTPVAGIYTVIVDSYYNPSGTGDYRLTLAKSGAPLATSPDDQGGAMTNGTTYSGDLYAGDVDTYTIVAAADEYIAVSIGRVNSTTTLTPRVRVVSPTGALLGSYYATSEAAAQVNARAPVAGIYTVIVDSYYNPSGTGDYRLTLAKSGTSPVTSAGDQGSAMISGVTYTADLYAGDLDTWTFTAAAGDYAVVSMGRTSVTATLTPRVRVISPTGALLGSYYATSEGAAQVSATTPVAGVYTVIVDSYYNPSGTGEYTLSVTGLRASVRATRTDGRAVTPVAGTRVTP